MSYLVSSDLVISINSFKQGMYYVIYVSSMDDIRSMNWSLGDRAPVVRSTQVVSDSDGVTIYMVMVMYPEKYFVKLQLNREIVQESYRGIDLIDYLMTASTFFGFFEEQEAYYKEIEARQFASDIAIVIGAVVAGMSFVLLDIMHPPKAVQDIEETDE